VTVISFYKKESGEFNGFSVTGHSGFAEKGRDIVCAAVSAAVWTVCNGISRVVGAAVDLKQDGADVDFRLLETDGEKNRLAQVLIRSFYKFAVNLKEQYGGYVEVVSSQAL